MARTRSLREPSVVKIGLSGGGGWLCTDSTNACTRGGGSETLLPTSRSSRL